MEKISNLTYQMVAFTEVPHFNTDKCIDWSIEMLLLGYESPSLLTLAGLDKPTNFFETVDYLKSALEELHLKIKTGEEGVLSYASYYIEQIAKGINIKHNLAFVYSYASSKDYEKSIYDFYLLYWAWDDLDYGNAFQHYWQDVTKENIESTVILVADKWIKENKKHYALTIPSP